MKIAHFLMFMVQIPQIPNLDINIFQMLITITLPWEILLQVFNNLKRNFSTIFA